MNNDCRDNAPESARCSEGYAELRDVFFRLLGHKQEPITPEERSGYNLNFELHLYECRAPCFMCGRDTITDTTHAQCCNFCTNAMRESFHVLGNCLTPGKVRRWQKALRLSDAVDSAVLFAYPDCEQRIVWYANGIAFRIAEDGTCADMNDTQIDAPPKPWLVAKPEYVGVNWPRWQQIFSDYFIMSPFGQMNWTR